MPGITLSEFADRMNEVMSVIIKEFVRRQTKELYKSKITLPQFLILKFLHSEGQSRMTELAHFMNVTTAAMTGIVGRLVKNGYVMRAYDKRDRRIIKVRLTLKGNELARKINEQRRQMVVKKFGGISGTGRKDYLRILMQIRDILIKESPISNKLCI